MSSVATYCAIVSDVLKCPGDSALDVPIVLGNQAVAIYYEKNGQRWRFANGRRAR